MRHLHQYVVKYDITSVNITTDMIASHCLQCAHYVVWELHVDTFAVTSINMTTNKRMIAYRYLVHAHYVVWES